ncbi:MAG TPA: glycosyltransferase family 1 protein [Croceibacterium sp.]
MRIAIVTDAWEPQVNGVVNAIRNLLVELGRNGHRVLLVEPGQFRTVPCPTYPEIRLALTTPGRVGRGIETFAPDAVHLMTEGPLCLAARNWCVRRNVPFTSAFCTNFPDYLEARTRIPERFFWPYFRWFHGASSGTFGSTASVREKLASQRIPSVRAWGRGVDLANFSPDTLPPELYFTLPRPIMLYVGRIAVEKNVEAFLRCTRPGTKVLVGDGPARVALQARYPEARFLGVRHGKELASAYAGADVFVFPSRTDTFGVVMIEALACGTPVAAYPVDGPRDVVDPGVGTLDEDLDVAIGGALACDREACSAYGRSFTWQASAQQFLDALEPLGCVVPSGARGAARHAFL